MWPSHARSNSTARTILSNHITSNTMIPQPVHTFNHHVCKCRVIKHVQTSPMVDTRNVCNHCTKYSETMFMPSCAYFTFRSHYTFILQFDLRIKSSVQAAWHFHSYGQWSDLICNSPVEFRVHILQCLCLDGFCSTFSCAWDWQWGASHLLSYLTFNITSLTISTWAYSQVSGARIAA